ncbi:MAG: HK97 family phage prohead protease [Gallionellaceae bacterium]|nr:HK97 family phage prohead protease [Gallionellaceae bacterium]
MDLWTLADWSAALAKGETPTGVVRKTYPTDSITPVPNTDGTESRRLRFAISTGAVDRQHDVIDPTGWETNDYLKNPIVLWAHNYDDLPVAKAISLGVEGNALIAEAEFVPGDVYPFAETVYQMLKGGFLNATSVGFRPKKTAFVEDRQGYDIQQAELLEFSIVPVPANPEALILARSAGVDVQPLVDWATKTLAATQGEGRWFPTALAEKAQAVVEAVSQIAAGELPTAHVVEQAPGESASAAPLSNEAELDNPDIKRGRVLSAKNETLLRQAVDLLATVLSQLDALALVGDEPSDAASAEPAAVAAVEPTTPDPPSPVLDGISLVLADPTPPSPVPPVVALTARDLDDLDAYVRGRVQHGIQAALASLTGRLPD